MASSYATFRTRATDQPFPLTESEKRLLSDTAKLFGKPDEDISPEHADRLESMPTYDA